VVVGEFAQLLWQEDLTLNTAHRVEHAWGRDAAMGNLPFHHHVTAADGLGIMGGGFAHVDVQTAERRARHSACWGLAAEQPVGGGSAQ